MVSRRKFFSIAIMMFVLLFLFQFSMVLRDRQNTYDVNSNLAPKQNDGKNVWKNEELDPASVGTTDRRYVLFVGDSSSDMAEAVADGVLMQNGIFQNAVLWRNLKRMTKIFREC